MAFIVRETSIADRTNEVIGKMRAITVVRL